VSAAQSWREPAPAPTKPPPKEARCAQCGGWIATVPAETKWMRGRCGNRRCRLYGEGQTIKLQSR